jgi:hypothetical protein
MQASTSLAFTNWPLQKILPVGFEHCALQLTSTSAMQP